MVMESPRALDWAALRAGQRIRLHHEAKGSITAVIEQCAQGSSVMWIYMTDGGGRLLIHRDDGYRLEDAEQG